MKFRNTLILLLFGGALGALALREQERGTFEQADRTHRAFLQANPGPDAPATGVDPGTPRILMARMDDVDQPQSQKTFAAWPLNESDWSLILSNLPEYKPRVTALADYQPESENERLQTAARAVPGLLVAARATADKAGEPTAELPAGLPVLKVGGSLADIPVFTRVSRPAAGVGTGIQSIDLAERTSRVSLEDDWCRVPMLARQGDRVVPSLALLALIQWQNIKPEDLVIQIGSSIRVEGRMRIPIDSGGFFRYYVSLSPPMESLNASTFILPLAKAKLAETPQAQQLLPALNDSLLWIAHDDLAARTHVLPSGTRVSAAELTVRALGAMQTGRFFRPVSFGWQVAACGGLLLCCLVLVHVRKVWLWPLTIISAGAVTGLSVYLFQRDHLWLPLTPLFAVLAGTILLSYILPRPGWRGTQPLPQPTRTGSRQGVVAPEPLTTKAAVRSPATIELTESEVPPVPSVGDVTGTLKTDADDGSGPEGR